MKPTPEQIKRASELFELFSKEDYNGNLSLYLPEFLNLYTQLLSELPSPEPLDLRSELILAQSDYIKWINKYQSAPMESKRGKQLLDRMNSIKSKLNDPNVPKIEGFREKLIKFSKWMWDKEDFAQPEIIKLIDQYLSQQPTERQPTEKGCPFDEPINK